MSLQQDRQPSSLVGNRSFRHYWSGRVLSMSAYQMQVVATGWSVYELTGSALDLGLVGLAQFLPRILLTPWAGAAADRLDRRGIVCLCTLVQFCACALLAYHSWRGTLSRELIFGLIAALGAARSFEMPTMQSLLPNIVPSDLFAKALAMSTAATQIAIIGGPALAGLIFVISATAVYATAATMFLGSCLIMVTMATVHRVVLAKSSSNSLWAGLHFIFKQPVVLGAISLDLFAVLLGGATALLPIFAKDILHVSATGLGLLQAAPAVGALLMTIYLARFPLAQGVGFRLFLSVAIFGIGTIVFALSNSFWLSLASLAVLGAADCVSVVIRQALVQLETPDDMRGRVSAVNSVFIGASNQLGEFESGVMAAWLGAAASVVVGGVGTLIVVAAWIWLFPELWRRDRLESTSLPSQ